MYSPVLVSDSVLALVTNVVVLEARGEGALVVFEILRKYALGSSSTHPMSSCAGFEPEKRIEPRRGVKLAGLNAPLVDALCGGFGNQDVAPVALLRSAASVRRFSVTSS